MIFYKSGLWTVTSYHLRLLIAVLFAASALYSFYKNKHLTWTISREKLSQISITALSTLICLSLSLLTIAGGLYSNGFVSLKFPFNQGTYSVIQGGSNVMTNPFHGVSANGKYAIDMVKINKLGNRTKSLFPKNLSQYHIFGEEVRSPCKGDVVTLVKDLPDNLPPQTDYENSADYVAVQPNSNFRCK